jgi:hypothetical protein
MPNVRKICARWLYVLAAISVLNSSAVSQQAVSGLGGVSDASSARSPVSVVLPALNVLTKEAGYIFVGKVLAVAPRASTSPQEVGIVQITFHVEEGIRGAASGSNLTVAEWAGLWNGSERYRVGERILLFLYPSSALGLTSPVGGRQGRLAVDRMGQVEVTPGQRVLLPAEATNRRVGTRLPVRELTRSLRMSIRQEER